MAIKTSSKFRGKLRGDWGEGSRLPAWSGSWFLMKHSYPRILREEREGSQSVLIKNTLHTYRSNTHTLRANSAAHGSWKDQLAFNFRSRLFVVSRLISTQWSWWCPNSWHPNPTRNAPKNVTFGFMLMWACVWVIKRILSPAFNSAIPPEYTLPMSARPSIPFWRTRKVTLLIWSWQRL